MIHAQRPDATACAEYDFWNKKMGRFVRRGSTGIALIDTSGQKPQLRYVFDVADTGEREHSRPMHLWQFRAEHEDAVAATLERNYDVSGSNGIVEQMESAAAQLAKEYWKDHKRDILYNIDDSYLDGYDLKKFPEDIEKSRGFISGLEADMKTLAAHPHPEDGFAGMTVKNDNLTDKDNAGAALLEAFKDVRGMEPVPIGTYRGFQMSLTLEDFGKDYVLTLKGQMTHRVTLGKDARGNLTRIDNVLNAMPDRLQNVRNTLDATTAQMEAAKAELGKPFPQEEELRVKSARLAELNAELNIDERTPMEQLADDAAISAKAERPSVLARLKNTPTRQTQDTPGKQREQESR